MTDASKGNKLAQQAAKQADLGCIVADGGLTAQVKADAFGVSIYTRKNLRTAFGGNPIFVAAGGLVTYSFVDLRTLAFKNAGVVKSMGSGRRSNRPGRAAPSRRSTFETLSRGENSR